jgi:hypothetical protein
MKLQRSESSPISADFATKIAATSVIASLLLAACSSPAASPSAPAASATDSTPPTATVSPEPSLTPTPALLELEILEWFEHDVPNKSNAEDTDTTVEILFHNPNDAPVRIDQDSAELRFLNSAGEVVYTNPNPVFHIWQGEWMTANQTGALSACVCFWNSGLETKEWESFELVAPLEVMTPPAYTTDVEFTAEFVLLEEVLHGYEGPGVATTYTNTSDQALEGIPSLVFAYDSNGRFVGTASFGTAVVSFRQGTDLAIQPGDTASGFEVSEIDYMGNARLTYEAQAIGIIAEDAPTPGAPEGTPSADYHGVPIMPGATNGGEANDGYTFSTQASIEEITQFYETALAELGYSLTTSGEQQGVSFLFFENGSAQAVVAIMTMGGSNLVQLVVTP